MKKILLISATPPPIHGAAFMVHYLLANTPNDSKVKFLHINTRYTSDLSTLTSFSFLKLLKMVGYLAQTIFLCLSRKIDAVVVTPAGYFVPFCKDAVFIWVANFLLRKKVIGWFHMDWHPMGYEGRGFLGKWFLQASMKRLHRVVVLGTRLKDRYPAFLDPGKMVVLPNGIPMPNVPRRNRSGSGQNEVKVLFLSNLREAKGWHEFVTAAAMLAEAYPQAKFLIHGAAHGSSEADVKKAIDATSFADRIIYGGPAYDQDKWELLANVDILCFPSHHEAFPLTILEAMAAGLPILATDVGSLSDALIDGKGGWIVQPKDVPALVDRLGQLLDSEETRKQFGAFNQHRFVENYTVEHFSSAWHSFLLTC